MAAETEIPWCDHTFNPWWGCTRVSPGCDHCYAEAWDARFGGEHWGAGAPRRLFGPKHWAEPRKWNAAAEKAGVRRRVFCASMADVFDPEGPDSERVKLWTLIQETPWLDWLLLTKRPQLARRYLPWLACRCGDAPVEGKLGGGGCPIHDAAVDVPWTERGEPWSNVWLGTTVEDQERAERRIPRLLETPAALRFLSVEPLLAPVDLRRWLRLSRFRENYFAMVAQIPGGEEGLPEHLRWNGKEPAKLDWVIVGGESGPGARPCALEWIGAVVDQCRAAGVPVFVKQDSGPKPGRQGRIPDDIWIKEFPHAR